MNQKIKTFLETNFKKNLPEIKVGDIVRVYQKVTENSDGKEKTEKSQVFEGQILARKHGKEMGASIVVRKVSLGVGIERTFPLYSPLIEKIEVVKRGRVRRAKLYYLREAKGRKARLRKGKFLSSSQSVKEDSQEKLSEEEKID
jgi:large subunit ribosomal protein L19